MKNKTGKCIKRSHLRRRFGSFLFEVLELHDLCHDEALLEVSVDTPGSLGGFRVFLEKREKESSVRSLQTHDFFGERDILLPRWSKP